MTNKREGIEMSDQIKRRISHCTFYGVQAVEVPTTELMQRYKRCKAKELR
jgi:hypothetical protein